MKSFWVDKNDAFKNFFCKSGNSGTYYWTIPSFKTISLLTTLKTKFQVHLLIFMFEVKFPKRDFTT